MNPDNEFSHTWIGSVQEAARAKGLQLPILKAATEGEIDAAFASLVQLRADGLVLGADPFLSNRREQVVALASRHALPAIDQQREFAEAGGLMSYGFSPAEGYREMGRYAGRILNGEKPADLPVLQPTKYELVINLKAAKAQNFEFPTLVRALADEVIE